VIEIVSAWGVHHISDCVSIVAGFRSNRRRSEVIHASKHQLRKYVDFTSLPPLEGDHPAFLGVRFAGANGANPDDFQTRFLVRGIQGSTLGQLFRQEQFLIFLSR
jgi:hypothetical protein